MNRLVLIGNGFDLAHGLKTSYCDFITDYLSTIINEHLAKGITSYEDELIKMAYNQKDWYETQNIGHRLKYENFFQTYEYLVNNEIINVSYKSGFFELCCKKSHSLRWVDIEQEYFEALLRCKQKNGSFDFVEVEKLNEQLECIREKLREYLKKINKLWDEDKSLFMQKTLSVKGDPQNDLYVTEDGDVKLNKDILMLSFNYTNLVNSYRDALNEELRLSAFTSICIHGTLSGKDDMIFGFGDEFDKRFSEFEELNNNALFKHVKSFGYVKTEEYRKLLQFVNGEKFEVHVLGHSCGLSDRTLLREIFDNNNCKRVKLFYYQKTDGTTDLDEKRFDLYRHFSDKARFRRIVSHQVSIMPQCQLNLA